MARTFFAQVVLPTNASPSASHAIRFDKFLSKHAKDSVALATAAALPAYSRSANTITASANGALTVDGVAVSTGDRILVKDGAAAIDNGIYTVTATGGVGAPYVLDRATDFDESADVAKGCRTIAQGGSANAGKIFYISAFAGSLNSDGITFSSPAGTSYTASTGVTLSGSDFQLASSSAGAGLTFAAGVLDVVAADTSLTVGANNVGVNLAAGSGLQVSSGLKIQLEAANPTLAVVSSELGLKFDSNSFTKGSSGLALAAGVAGNGLALAAGVLAVNAANGLEVASDSVGIANDGVTTARIAKDTARRYTVYNTMGGPLDPDTLLHVSGWNVANSAWVIERADADAGKPANLVLNASLAENTVGEGRDLKLSAADKNTSGSAVGDPVYLSTTPGAWTLTAPTGATATQQIIGRVVVVNAATGQIQFNTCLETRKIGTTEIQNEAITAALIAAGVAGNGLTGGAGSPLAVVAADTSLTVGADNVGINLAAGSGLAINSGLKINIEAANPTLKVTASELGVKYASTLTTGANGLDIAAAGVTLAMLKSGASGGVYHATTFGGSGTSYTITHGLGVRYNLVQCFDSNGNIIDPDIQHTSTTQTALTFTTDPGANCRVVIYAGI